MIDGRGDVYLERWVNTMSHCQSPLVQPVQAEKLKQPVEQLQGNSVQPEKRRRQPDISCHS